MSKYVCCGICGGSVPQEMADRDDGSDTGWVCDDCYYIMHPEYEDWGED